MPTEKTASTLIPGKSFRLKAKSFSTLDVRCSPSRCSIPETDRFRWVRIITSLRPTGRCVFLGPRLLVCGLIFRPAPRFVFEPGEEKVVQLVPFGGQRTVLGLNGLTEGNTQEASVRQRALQKASEQGFLSSDEETGG